MNLVCRVGLFVHGVYFRQGHRRVNEELRFIHSSRKYSLECFARILKDWDTPDWIDDCVKEVHICW